MEIVRKLVTRLNMLRYITLVIVFLGPIQFTYAAELSVGVVKNIYANTGGASAFILDSGFSAAAVAQCPNFNGYAAFAAGNRLMNDLVQKSFDKQAEIRVYTQGCTGAGNWLRVYSVSISTPPAPS